MWRRCRAQRAIATITLSRTCTVATPSATTTTTTTAAAAAEPHEGGATTTSGNVPGREGSSDTGRRLFTTPSAAAVLAGNRGLTRILRVLERRPTGVFPLQCRTQSKLWPQLNRKQKEGRTRRRRSKERGARAGEHSAAEETVKGDPASSPLPWQLLQPQPFLFLVRTALMEVILSCDRPLSVGEVLAHFQVPEHRRTLAEHEARHPSASALATLHHLMAWLEYALALHDFRQAFLPQPAKQSEEKLKGEEASRAGPRAGDRGRRSDKDDSNKGSEGAASLERRRSRASHVRTAWQMRKVLAERIPCGGSGAGSDGTTSRGNVTATPRRKKNRKRRLALLRGAILQDCISPPVVDIAPAYRTLYERCAVSLLRDVEGEEAAAGVSGGGEGEGATAGARIDPAVWEVSHWVPLALLLADPHFRIMDGANGTKASAPSRVCFPVRPSVLMAAMDPLKLPSLRQQTMNQHQQRHRSGDRGKWTLAVSLAQCTDATRALTGLPPPPSHFFSPVTSAAAAAAAASTAPSWRLPKQPPRMGDAGDAGDNSSMVDVWVRWAVLGSGDGATVVQEGLGVALCPMPDHALPSSHRMGASAAARRVEHRSDRGSGSRSLSSLPMQKEAPLHHHNNSTEKENAASATTVATEAERGRTHNRSADGKANELLRRATGWNETVVGNPVLNAWAGAGSAKHNGEFASTDATVARRRSLSATSALDINRATLQPLFLGLWVTPLSLARLSTLLRWNLTCPFASHYHNSLLYFLLLHAGSPDVRAAQEKEERRLAVLTSSAHPAAAASSSLGGGAPAHGAARVSACVGGRQGETKRLLAVYDAPAAAAGHGDAFDDAKKEVLNFISGWRQELASASGAGGNSGGGKVGIDRGHHPSRTQVRQALTRAAAWERLSLTAATNTPVLTYKHNRGEQGKSVRGRSLLHVNVHSLLDALTTCPTTVGRLLFVRLLRSPNAKNHADGRRYTGSSSSNNNDVGNGDAITTPHAYQRIEVLDTDHTLPQDILAHLVAIAKAAPSHAQGQQTPRSVPQLLANELDEDILVFPLSRRVFLARAYATAAAYAQWVVTPDGTGTEARSQDKVVAAMTVGRLAELMLWSFEFGDEVGAELMLAYLARFPDMVQVRLPPCANGSDNMKTPPVAEWDVHFTV